MQICTTTLANNLAIFSEAEEMSETLFKKMPLLDIDTRETLKCLLHVQNFQCCLINLGKISTEKRLDKQIVVYSYV